ncbi:MAG: hypothetical protein R2849_15025 [Thermomicrobiales bacterium]
MDAGGAMALAELDRYDLPNRALVLVAARRRMMARRALTGASTGCCRSYITVTPPDAVRRGL